MKLARFGRRFYKGTKLSVAIGAVRQKGLRTTLEIGRKKKAASRASQ